MEVRKRKPSKGSNPSSSNSIDSGKATEDEYEIINKNSEGEIQTSSLLASKITEKDDRTRLWPLIIFALTELCVILSYDRCVEDFSSRKDCGFPGVHKFECVNFAMLYKRNGLRCYLRVALPWILFGSSMWKISRHGVLTWLLYLFGSVYIAHQFCGCCHNDKVGPGVPHCY